jgi:hypothetical protein
MSRNERTEIKKSAVDHQTLVHLNLSMPLIVKGIPKRIRNWTQGWITTMLPEMLGQPMTDHATDLPVIR